MRVIVITPPPSESKLDALVPHLLPSGRTTILTDPLISGQGIGGSGGGGIGGSQSNIGGGRGGITQSSTNVKLTFGTYGTPHSGFTINSGSSMPVPICI